MKRSFLRRNSTPRTPGRHPDAQPRGLPTCAGAARPEKAPQPERGHQHHSGRWPGECPPQWGLRSGGAASLEGLLPAARLVKTLVEKARESSFPPSCSPPLLLTPPEGRRAGEQVRGVDTGSGRVHSGGGRGNLYSPDPGRELRRVHPWHQALLFRILVLPLPRWVTLGELLISLIPHQ